MGNGPFLKYTPCRFLFLCLTMLSIAWVGKDCVLDCFVIQYVCNNIALPMSPCGYA